VHRVADIRKEVSWHQQAGHWMKGTKSRPAASEYFIEEREVDDIFEAHGELIELSKEYEHNNRTLIQGTMTAEVRAEMARPNETRPSVTRNKANFLDPARHLHFIDADNLHLPEGRDVRTMHVESLGEWVRTIFPPEWSKATFVAAVTASHGCTSTLVGSERLPKLRLMVWCAERLNLNWGPFKLGAMSRTRIGAHATRPTPPFSS
jgi:hypothetical protein